MSDKQKDSYFKSYTKAKTLVKIPFDLDNNNQLLLVSDDSFDKGMAQKLNYFHEVITFEELEKQIIKANKQDEVGSLNGKIGINKAYRRHKKFLYLRFDDNKKDNKSLYLKLINPENFEEIFVADIKTDYSFFIMLDQNTFYPLFNALIDYIKENSKTYK